MLLWVPVSCGLLAHGPGGGPSSLQIKPHGPIQHLESSLLDQLLPLLINSSFSWIPCMFSIMGPHQEEGDWHKRSWTPLGALAVDCPCNRQQVENPGHKEDWNVHGWRDTTKSKDQCRETSNCTARSTASPCLAIRGILTATKYSLKRRISGSCQRPRLASQATFAYMLNSNSENNFLV